MGFLAGSATFERYWITKDPTPALGAEHIKILEKFQIGKLETVALDEPRLGFVAGAHLLDTSFSAQKNIVEDALHFGVRVDSDQIPAAIRNAWLQMELLPLIAENDGGKPTKSQREEAKELVQARCEEEAATGKYRRMSQTPILWDAANDEVYVGSSSSTANELCVELLQRAFDIELEHVSSGTLARTYATEYQLLDRLFDVSPAAFTDEDGAGGVTWWNGMAENYDYLGNEFLLWLWWQWETKSDTLKLSDDTQVSGIFARTLLLDCPRGESGKDTISAEFPIALPEASFAIKSGKLPRKAGLTLVRDGEQYDFNLQAERFAVGSAKISRVGEDGPMDPTERLQGLRNLSETLDLLFDAFCDRRLGDQWKTELKSIREWLKTDKVIRRRAA